MIYQQNVVHSSGDLLENANDANFSTAPRPVPTTSDRLAEALMIQVRLLAQLRERARQRRHARRSGQDDPSISNSSLAHTYQLSPSLSKPKQQNTSYEKSLERYKLITGEYRKSQEAHRTLQGHQKLPEYQPSQPEIVAQSILANTFVRDANLKRLFLIALECPTITYESLDRTLVEILIAYSSDLQEVAGNELERLVFRFIRRSAKQTALLIIANFDPKLIAVDNLDPWSDLVPHDSESRSNSDEEEIALDDLRLVEMFLTSWPPMLNLHKKFRAFVETSVRDLFFIPESLPELVDFVFDFFNKDRPASEESLPPGKTRLRWNCSCGTPLYHDVPEAVPELFDSWRKELQRTHETPRTPAINTRQFFGILFNGILGVAGRTLSPRGSHTGGDQERGGTDLPTYNTSATGTDSMPPGEQRSENSLRLLFCIDKGDPLSTICQASLEGVPENNDECLFQRMRDEYWRHRKIPSWFTLRYVEKVSLVKCMVDLNSFAQVDRTCRTISNRECMCLPPKERCDGTTPEYKCNPVGSGHPIISPETLTHYFKKRHIFGDTKDIGVYDQMPKKTADLSTHPAANKRVEAWGVFFQEGWHRRTIYFLFSVSVVGSLAFAIVWSVVLHKSVGDAFTAAGYLVATCVGFLTLLAWIGSPV
ncbi:hypothetical protein F5Y16DRAFT_378994 [Xylariaceae sp. FL0255]|nr:hypothetical protein F5Y16DRAFT_378994 [Xylariaceae sp. FL0255]